ncbi:MAG: PorT family protein [Bacteroidetes bacterium]|uniref:PorT family protein n=1 Tax=Candidatus Cryptobacteroides faecipullorum TaxID=2840764 RepID=A0A9D9NBD0_9BACT|nr:PorT family protein [Candidatus Cryptobacteroides faecipullorum]
MKKIYIILAAAALFMCVPFCADAQHFGVKAGVNFSDPESDVKTNLGYQAGIAVQCDLPLWFSIQPELLFHVKGGQAAVSGKSDPQAFGLGYLELPVNIQWGPRFSDDRFRIFVQGSPFIGYAISKDMKNARGESYDWKNINRFEYGLGAGLGIQLWRHFQIVGQYNWSLGDLVRSGFAEQEFKRIFDESNFSGYTVSLAIIF